MNKFIKLERSSGVQGIHGKDVFINVDAIQMIDWDVSPSGKIRIWLNDGRSAYEFRPTGKNNAEIGMLVYGKDDEHD